MEAASNIELTQDRRHSAPERAILMSRLSMSQKFAANGLSQYGYDIAFIRNENSASYAVMVCGDSVATIDIQGEINTSPDIIIRS